MPFLPSPRPAPLRSPIFSGLALLAFLALAILPASGQSGTSSSVDGFDPNIDGIVYAQVLQSDGKSIVAGNFTTVRPNGGAAVARSGVARLNVDGSVDTSFVNPGVAGTVSTLALQSDGRILIGGAFTTVQPDGSGVFARRNIARLNADGTVDSTFDPGASARVNAIALQSDGRILVGGAFTTLQPNGGATVARSYIARLNADGTVDPAYDPRANQPVLSLALQADGEAVVGGFFTSFQPNGGAVSNRSRLARLNTDGTVDPVFDPSPNAEILTIVVQADAKIIIGGNFGSLQPNGATAPVFFPYSMRLNPDGSVDRTFYPRPNAGVHAIKLQSDGRIVLGGRFTVVQTFGIAGAEVPRTYLVRFNADGSLDTSFNPTPNFHVYTIEEQADGKLLVGGNFNQFRNQGSSAASTIRNQFARLNRDGSVDTTLDPNTHGRVVDMAAQSDGRIVLVGNFASVGGITRNYIARVSSSGALDTSFAPTVNGPITTVAVQADGKVVIGGLFTQVNGVTRSYLARLNTDGSLDASWDPSANFNVATVVLQSDGKLLVGGLFTSFLPNGTETRVIRNRIARINTDGTVDSGFDPNANEIVFDIVPQSNGKILISGTFTGVSGTNGGNLDFPRDFVARLNADGTLDHGFTIHPGGAIGGPRSILAIAAQSDDKVIISGAFVRAAGSTSTAFEPRNRIARFNADGSIDLSFNPDANGTVNTVIVQPDGKILIAGGFTSVGGAARVNIARLNSDGTLDTSFNPNPEGQLGTQPGGAMLQADGRILFSGSFTFLSPNGGSPVFRSQIARLNANGTVDTTFDSGISGQPNLQIDAIAAQPDGRVILGGSFSTLGGSNSSNLARFNSDGSPDTSFSPSADGPVHAVAIRPGITPSPAHTTNFAYLNSDGSLRANFDPGSNVRIEGQVFVSVAQADGKVLIGGAFTNLGAGSSNNLLRLNTDGTLDTSFTVSPDLQVNQIIILPDGKLLVAGGFTSLSGVGRTSIARLHPNGAVDLDFVNINADGPILTMFVQSDGKIVVGGNFENILPVGAPSGTTRPRLARLNADGTLDGSFTAATNGTVNAIVQQSDGRIVVGGTFSQVQGTGTNSPVTRLGIARFDANGVLDSAYDPNLDDTAFNTTVLALALQADGRLLVGGEFVSFARQSRTGLVRLNTDGTVDTGFTPNPVGFVSALGIQPDGRILVGGSYTRISGVTRNNMARLFASGVVDASFNLNTNGRVNSFSLLSDGTVLVGGTFTTVQPSGAILAGGSFTSIGGITASNLALLNADGTAGSPFQPNPNGAVYALAAQTDGRVVVGGAFTVIGGLSRNRLARISADGNVDTAFNPDVNGTVHSAFVQSDGRIVIAGSFSSVGGAGRSNIARLNADGSVDGSFDAPTNGTVYVVLPTPEGGLLIGGTFTVAAGSARDRIARLDASGVATGFNPGANGPVHALALHANGSIVAGGDFTVTGGVARNRLARYNADGTVDLGFNPSSDGIVTSATIQEDGKTIVGGRFTSIGGRTRTAVARFGAPASVGSSISISNDLSTISWSRSGSSPEVTSVAFETSTDSVEWRAAGNGTRVGSSGTWQLAGQSLSVGQSLFIRVRGVTQGSQYASSGLVERVAAFLPRPVLTSADSVTATSGSSFFYAISTSTSATGFSASGLPPGLSLDGSAGYISGTPTQTGIFNVSITATSAAGSAVSNLTITVAAGSGATSPDGRLIALSTRALVRTGNPLVSGIVINGSEPKSVLFRAVGPGLVPLGVPGVLNTPLLRIFNSSGTMILETRSWGGSSALAAVFSRLGNFALDPNSADSAVLVTLNPGSYTAQVLDGAVASTGGNVLAEVYDASDSNVVGAPRLIAISSRGLVDSGGNTLVGGLAIAGSSPKKVILRGVGPNLAKSGIGNALGDPVLTVFNSAGQVLARNDNWGTPVTVNNAFPAASAATIASTAAAVGLAAYDSGSNDAAIVMTLPPGVYTVQVTPSASISEPGTGMVEIYEAP